ncbi:MAG: recombinase family protein, partial [Clostridia bacterium]|nr:recombinase family protein [Clostridia bacterium]
MNGVIYARYSSHAQNEQSIEGQLKECYRYAESNGINIIREYIDRAQTGTNDNREQFQKMILDSKSGDFDTIVVYQLDRFARNRYDSAVNKAILKKNGVRVLSARENITDDASGILVEGILESLAEYYSAELSQKVRRGMLINAEKCQFNGGSIPFGYSIDKDKHYAVNPDQAFIVVEIFERYLSGETIKSITDDLRVRQIKTNKGSYLDKSSLLRMLRNKRYTGSYIYASVEIPDSIPAIVPKELFDKVQPMLDKNSRAPGRRRDEDEYLLTTKLFCGKCKEMMVGYGGTSKNGNVYHYYICKSVRRKKCDKKIISKAFAEETVIKTCKKLLNDMNIDKIVAGIEEACNSDAANSAIRKLEKSLDDLNKSIDKLLDSIE